MQNTIESEHTLCRQKVGLFDLSGFGVLEATGPDARPWLQNLLTNDIKKLQIGQLCQAAFLTPQGKIRGVAFVLCLPDKFLLFCDPALREKMPKEMLRYRISEKVEIRDGSDSYGKLLIQGPQAMKLADDWSKTSAPTENTWTMSNSSKKVLIARLNNNLNDPQYLILCPKERLTETQAALLGNPVHPVACGMETYESLRIEGGMPRYGIDFNEEILLPEAGLEHLASTTKGCYIGQEFVVRIRDRGQIHRRLKKLSVDATSTVAPKSNIFDASGQTVGETASSAFIPTLQRVMALAYLKKECWEPGTKVTVEDRGKKVSATVF